MKGNAMTVMSLPWKRNVLKLARMMCPLFSTSEDACRKNALAEKLVRDFARRYYREHKDECDSALNEAIASYDAEARKENAEFAARLSSAAGLLWSPASLEQRQMHVHVSRANHGAPSSVLIEFDGSPSKFPVFMGDVSYSRLSRPLFINGKWFKSGPRSEKCCLIIEDFLCNRGFLKRP